MKKLINQIICGFIAIVVVMGLATGSASAQSLSTTDGPIPDSNGGSLLGYQCNSPQDVDKLYPYPSYPNYFFSCTPYGLQLMKCPEGLAFDVKANRCEYTPEPIVKP